MKLESMILVAVLAVSGGVHAQVKPKGQVGPAFQEAPPPTKAQKLAEGLAAHDFLYAGEALERNLYVVRGGKVAWSFNDADEKGEISDAVMESNGNILFSHQFGISEVAPQKIVVWHYDAPAGTEVHTAIPIGKDRVLYVQNGDVAVVRVIEKATGATVKEFNLKTKLPPSVHGQFRHVRLTAQGTLLVAHMDLNKVVEYDTDGNELWSFPADKPWGVTPLTNGNVLITDSKGVREITRRGDTAWSWTPADTPEYAFANLQQAWRLPNGNTVINNWVNEWEADPKDVTGTVQAIEVTPAKKVVWVLNSWKDAENLGPATTFQFLDGTAAEDVHFGDIK
ncbi:MAG: PQQ-binding-like beta-propeller repeat protein [Terracidiphilus sp.]